VPALLSYLQVDVDALAGQEKGLGRWVLTGSHQPRLRDALAQSLAGRTALLQLMPLSLGELARWSRRHSLDDLLVSGTYPRLHDAEIPAHQFHADYLGTYLERDVRQIVRVADLGQFQRFLGFFFGRHAQIINYSQLGTDVGIDQATAKAWCGVLEASHVASPLRPWFANINKRLAKSPKWYLTDSGLAAHLIGITSSKHITTHAHRGHLFEGFIVTEALKLLAHYGSPARCHFFSTQREEVDLLVEANGKTLAVEIKSGATVASDWFKNLESLAKIPQANIADRMVVYGGDDEQRRSKGHVCPWWLFPLRMTEWLRQYDALPLDVDCRDLEWRLRTAFAPGS
jgi:predicted AAA+ superfamily ATPase